MHKRKVFIVQEVLAQFRIPLFNIIANDYDLEVLTSYPTKKKNRQVPPHSIIKFKHKLFNNFVLLNGKLSYHKELIDYCFTNLPDLLVMEPRIGFLTTIILALQRKGRYKIIWWLSGYESSKSLVIRSIKRIVFKLLLKTGDGFIVYSNEGKYFLNKLGIFQDIYIAYNSIDTNEVEVELTKVLEAYKNRRNIRLALNMDDIFTMISTGRITKKKNFDIILNAMQVLRQKYNIVVNYICVGDGSGLNDLKTLAYKLGIFENVKFTGGIYEESILSRYFLASDVYILPGIGGLAINHAIAYRKPLIVSFADGTEKDQALDNINSLYFTKLNIYSLVDKIKYCYDNPIRLQEMSKISGELSSRKFNINVMADTFINAVNKTL